MSREQDSVAASAGEQFAGCALAAIVLTAAVGGIALFLLKYGMTLSMLWWESR